MPRDLRQIDLNLLVTLDVLLEVGSVTKAAERLHLSQPAVSSQLRRLRDLFEDPLLASQGRQLALTPRARSLAGPLRVALEDLHRVTEAGATFKPDKDARTIKITSTDALHTSVSLPLMSYLRNLAPGLQFAFLPLATSSLREDLVAGTVDAAIVTPSTMPSDLESDFLFEEGFTCVGRRGHPAMLGGLDLESFCSAEHLLVSLVGGGFVGAVDAALQHQGRGRRVVCSVPSFLLVPEVLEGSDLLATVPRRIAERWQSRLALAPVPMPMAGFEVFAVWRRSADLDPALSWLREELRAWARRLP